MEAAKQSSSHYQLGNGPQTGHLNGGLNVIETSREIPSVINSVMQALEHAEHSVSLLEDRLVPIMSTSNQVGKTDGSVAPKRAINTGLGSSLDGFENRITALSYRISSMYDRAQL